MRNKKLSTFEREMKDPEFKKAFETEYQEFLLFEIINTLMENNAKSVRAFADEVGLSPSVIQKLRSGKQEDIKLRNFITISHACGYEIILKKGNDRILL